MESKSKSTDSNHRPLYCHCTLPRHRASPHPVQCWACPYNRGHQSRPPSTRAAKPGRQHAARVAITRTSAGYLSQPPIFSVKQTTGRTPLSLSDLLHGFKQPAITHPNDAAVLPWKRSVVPSADALLPHSFNHWNLNKLQKVGYTITTFPNADEYDYYYDRILHNFKAIPYDLTLSLFNKMMTSSNDDFFNASCINLHFVQIYLNLFISIHPSTEVNTKHL